jgi:hypothetical protein
MGANEEEKTDHQLLQEGEAFLIKGRVTELEREQEAARKRDNEYKDRQNLYSKRVAWFTGALVLTTIITNVIYLDMSCTARRAAKSTEDAVIQAKTNNEAAIAAQERIAQGTLEASQQNAKQSINATIQQFHLEQRAWVSAIETHGAPEVGKPFEIIVRVRNTGKTFAKEFSSIAVVEALPEGKYPDFSKESRFRTNSSVSLLAPDGEWLIPLYPIGGSSTEKFTDSMLADLKASRTKIFVYGSMRYKDIFDCNHWTTFCFRLSRTLLLYEACGSHNDADNNTCQQ